MLGLTLVEKISSFTLLALAVYGSFNLIFWLKRRGFWLRGRLAILRLQPESLGMRVGDFIKSLKPPFTFEVAVHHLGKDTNYYLVVSKHRARGLLNQKGIEEVEDYHIFHHGGEHLGVYLKGSSRWPDINFGDIDFSKVNEVGEGAVVQFVFGRRGRRRTSVNARIVVSAPSNFQAREIISAIKPIFSGFDLGESKR